MPGPEGLVLGECGGLPDATAVQNFDFSVAKRLSLSVWSMPEYPSAVLRRQTEVLDTEEEYWQFARLGIAHLQALQDNGVSMPAQRFVVGPDQYIKQPRLYAITERLHDRRELTYEPQDTSHAQTVIDGSAGYLLGTLAGHPTKLQFLFDTTYPWQHSVTGDQSTLHDVGLEFGYFANPKGWETLKKVGINLLRWADYIGIEPSRNLKQLNEQTETALDRRIRLAEERSIPALKTLVQRPAGIDLW